MGVGWYASAWRFPGSRVTRGRFLRRKPDAGGGHAHRSKHRHALVSCSLDTGDVELIQAATAVAAFAFLPFGQLNRSNIVVDTFTQRLPERVRAAIDAFWDIVYAAAAVILSWRLLVAALDAIRSHTVSTVIGLPIGWFMLAGVTMLFLLALVSVLTAGRLLRGSS